MQTTSNTPSAMLMMWRAGRMIGAPLMRPDSFAKAITEPGNVSAPIATPSDISTRLARGIAPGAPISKGAGGVARPRDANIEGGGGEKGARRDQYGGHADQRMKRRDQFRHRRHRHPS